MREKGDDFSGRRRRFRGRRGMILGKGEGEDFEGAGRDKKNLRNSEYSGFRLFGRIEWVPPLNTKKLLRVIRRTGKQPWGIFY